MNDSRFPPASKTDSRRSLVEACFRREAGSAASIPADSVDLLEAGILDSMAWVSFLRAVETASGVSDLGSGLNERSASLGEVLAALQNSASEMSRTNDAGLHQKISSSPAQAVLTGSSAVPGSRLLPSEEVDRAFGMPAGKLRSRAGIESLAHAAEGENELTLAARAAEEALRAASCGAQEMDWIIATSETHHDYPSLSAQLHSRLLVRENCGALDVGGACLGLLGQYAAAIQVSDERNGGLTVQFDGEALSRAAITRMEKVLTSVEMRSGIPRSSVGGFATHQPNPRLVTLLAKQCGVSPDTFPPVAQVSGNLGSSTCGAALHEILRSASKQPRGHRRPIFLASLGPGLLFGGGWLTPND